MWLSNRFSDLKQLNDQNELLLTEVTGLRATDAALQTEIAYANSDAAVEQYAREEGYMVRQGEVLVIPISPKKITPTPVFIPTPTIAPVSNWEIWYQLFFSPGSP